MKREESVPMGGGGDGVGGITVHCTAVPGPLEPQRIAVAWCNHGDGCYVVMQINLRKELQLHENGLNLK